MSAELTVLLQSLYGTELEARAVLTHIGYPAGSIPSFYTAETFWPQVVSGLDYRVKNGRLMIAKAAAAKNPGAADQVQGIIDRLADADPIVRPPGWNSPVQPEGYTDVLGTPNNKSYRNPAPPTGQGDPPLPPAPEYGPSGARSYPTLILDYANLPDEFLAATRGVVGEDADHLYITPAQSAVRIPDPGDQDEVVRQKVQEKMRVQAPSCLVTYRKYRFRPYLYKTLVVCGPDLTRYEWPDVPAIFTPEDIAYDFLHRNSREAATSPQGGLVRVVIDHERADDAAQRLDPYTTLHDCNVRDGDVLHVAPEAVAGSISPQIRMEHQLRAVAQIRGRAAEDDAEFDITALDDEEVPGRVTLLIRRNGLAPPADFDRFQAAGTWPQDPEADIGLLPVPVRQHRVSIYFPPMFPLTAPRVVFETPVFHPNIRHAAAAGLRAGTLQFHPLLASYRPEHNMAHVCDMIVKVAMYRDYDLTEGPRSANPAAAWWAGTDHGQAVILNIGGTSMADVRREGDRRTRPSRLFWLRPWGGEP